MPGSSPVELYKWGVSLELYDSTGKHSGVIYVQGPSHYVKPPCGGCKDRGPCCHDSCEGYKEYKNRLEIYRGMLRDANREKRM